MSGRGFERKGWAALRPALALALCTTIVGAQTRITPPKNKYTPEQDVQVGREAAAEVRREYPLINDGGSIPTSMNWAAGSWPPRPTI